MNKRNEKPVKGTKKEKNGTGANPAGVQKILAELKEPLTIINDAVKLLADLHGDDPDPRKKELIKTVQEKLEEISAVVDGLAAHSGEAEERRVNERVHFDVMNQVQQVCATHDILFLQKQLHYHISASADLPKVFASPEQILLVLSNLVSNAIKFAPRGTDIDINVKEVSLRQGAGIEITVINTSEEFTEKDRYHIFEKFYTGKKSESDKNRGFGLSVCREIIQQSHGQLWVDIPAKGKVAFAFVLPCAEVKGPYKQTIHQTFKYDITLANYEAIVTRFGHDKSQHLLQQVEEYVRKLVRYPVDVVTAFEQSGIISTIYETEEGHASSVATRISQKLGSENFHIGKDSVNVTFQYRLSTLQ